MNVMTTNGVIKTDWNLLFLLKFLTQGSNTYYCFYIDCVRKELSKSDPCESSDGSREFLFVSLRGKFYFSACSCSDFDLPLFLGGLLFLLNKVRYGNVKFKLCAQQSKRLLETTCKVFQFISTFGFRTCGRVGRMNYPHCRWQAVAQDLC
jgi:hypothetical protein